MSFLFGWQRQLPEAQARDKSVETRAKPCQGLKGFAGLGRWRRNRRRTMDWDDLKPKPKKAITVGEDLTNLSVSELEARIGELSQEIERVKAELGAKKAHEAAAAEIFKR
jgi:uncharacterized small protein (DUF1192 family)